MSGRRRVVSTGILMSLFAATSGAAPSWQAASGATGTTAGQKATKEKEETCRVSGMVVRAADGAPLKNATVQLSNGDDREHTIATKTGADGRFALKNVPSGRYKMIVLRNGYVRAEYGQRKASDPGAMLALAVGENKTEIFFKLVPAAVIGGRVFNEDGEPEPNASVLASRETYQEGHRTLTQVAGAQTDDVGAFRIFGLAPGRYFVSAMQESWGAVDGDKEYSGSGGESRNEQGMTKTYYPGTTDFSRASAINVKEGDEILGTDIALKQVTVHRIRGRVLNVVTHKPGQDVQVDAVPRSKQQEWSFGGRADVKKADGSFEISGVLPGQYTLFGFWFDPNERKVYSAAQKLEVGDNDVEGVLLTIGAGGVAQGRIMWDGKPSTDGGHLTVVTSPVDTYFVPTTSAQVDANDQFTLKDLMESDLKLRVEGISKDCYVKQMVFGQAVVQDDVIAATKGTNPALEITVSSRGARVQGVVTDKDGLPAAGVWVVAVPDEARRTLLRLFKAQTTDQYGKFDLHGLAPGEYKLFAWGEVEEHAWEDGEFLRPFEIRGAKIEVRDEDSSTMNLKVISGKGDGNN